MRLSLRQRPVMVPSRSFAFNIYDDAPSITAKLKGTPQEAQEAIFNQHADGETLKAGTSFSHACSSLADEYSELAVLGKDAGLVGRVFQYMDRSGDGCISQDEFLDGVQGLLVPVTDADKSLLARLAQGTISQVTCDFSHVKTVAIVGGGVAGLQTAAALTKVGLSCTIFEKSEDVGGVWRKNYADFGLQVPKELYEFPDFPYPEGGTYDKFPTGPQVQEYIQSYAKAKGLYDHIRLGTPVVKVDLKGGGQRGWKVVLGGKERGSETQTEDFDFCVIATGMYGWPPHLPLARGHENFKGEILHSQTFNEASQAAGKKVIVVGGGKSAIDNSVAASRQGVSSMLLYREAHWPVPRYLLNLIPFKWGTYSRFGHFMLPAHYDEGVLWGWIHQVCRPIKHSWWRIVETMFRVQFRLTGDMVPTVPIETDVFTGGQILTYDFRDAVAEGKIVACKGSIDRFTEDGKGVVLRDGTFVPADLVVYGTGFAKSYDGLDRAVQCAMEKSKDGLYLYRNMLPARVPDLAFVGAEVSTFNNILTQGMQALWLANVLAGKVTLPPPGKMEQAIEREQAWKRTWMPPTSARSSIWQLHMMKYHDTICKDLGVPHRRKGWNLVAEAFVPYNATDYRDLFK